MLASPQSDGSGVTTQIPAVGPLPSAGVLLIGSLLYATQAQAAEVLALVDDEDMATTSLSVLLAAVRSLVNAGTPAAPQLVLDVIQREGPLKRFALRDLQDAITCGAVPEAARSYGAAVLSISFRRQIESVGTAMTTAAAESAESYLAPMVNRAAEAIADQARRLELLRGEHS